MKYSYRAIAYRVTKIGPSFISISPENLMTSKNYFPMSIGKAKVIERQI